MSVGVGEQSHELQILFRLLIGSGLVTREEFEAARQLSVERNIPLTQAVTHSGLLSNQNLELSMEVQKRVLGNQITSDLGIRALRMALQQKLSLDEAIYSVQSMHEKTRVVVSAANELTSLLLNAKFITPEDLGRLIKVSSESQMMIGHLLLLDNKITAAELLDSLNVVLMCKEANLDKGKAAQGLRYARQSRTSVEEALVELGFFIHPPSNDLRLGELFLMARLISKEDYCECLEVELFKHKNFGQIVIERGIVNAYQLDCASKLLDFVRRREFKPWQAAEALWKVCNQGEDFESAVRSLQSVRDEDGSSRLSELLVHASICTRLEVQRAIHRVEESATAEAEALMKAGLIDRSIVPASLRLHTLLRLGFLPHVRVLEMLKHTASSSMSLDNSLARMGIYVPCRFQWTWT